jgi:hypothetical protein
VIAVLLGSAGRLASSRHRRLQARDLVLQRDVLLRQLGQAALLLLEVVLDALQLRCT